MPPKLKRWLAAGEILEYLEVMSSYGITFGRGSGLDLVVYTDAAYAPRGTRRNDVWSGAVVCGSVAIQRIFRTPKLPHSPRVRQSTLLWQRVSRRPFFYGRCGVFCCLIWGIRALIQVFEDNKGAIQIAVNPATASKLKHIDVRHH